MTATQHTPVTTEALPQAIRRLEAALPGDLAIAEGGSPCAMKMEADSGRPWLLDPWGHEGGPARATTAAIAQMGYRTDAYIPPRKVEMEPTAEAAWAHLDLLYANDWTAASISRATGMSASNLRRIRNGGVTTPELAARILEVDPDSLTTRPKTPMIDRLEDVEFLLDNGVEPEQATARCGFHNVWSAQRAATAAGLPVLRARLTTSPDPADPDLDDYDPYSDPDFA